MQSIAEILLSIPRNVVFRSRAAKRFYLLTFFQFFKFLASSGDRIRAAANNF